MAPLRRLHTTGKAFCPSLFDRTLNAPHYTAASLLLHEGKKEQCLGY